MSVRYVNASRFEIWAVSLCCMACSGSRSDGLLSQSLDAETPANAASDAGADAEAAAAESLADEDAGDSTGDGAVPTDDGGNPQVATLFINDSANGVVYRYNVTPTTDPVLTATIAAGPSAGGLSVDRHGALFVPEYTDPATIRRFTSALTSPVEGADIADYGGHFPLWSTFVDDELWVLSTAYRACTTDPSNLVRITFDDAGAASVAGEITANLNGANRGMLWDSEGRTLYITQCEAQRAIQRFAVDTAHVVTPLATYRNDALDNPHGMVMTPWRELIVANAGVASAPSMALARFSVDQEGNLTPNGSIEGNGLNLPIGLAIAPWGELFVVNNGTAVISRFTFDASHEPVANGSFAMSAPTEPQALGVGIPVFIAGASTASD